MKILINKIIFQHKINYNSSSKTMNLNSIINIIRNFHHYYQLNDNFPHAKNTLNEYHKLFLIIYFYSK